MFFKKRCSKAYNFIEIESLTQVFSCEFCEVSMNSFFTENLRTTASVFSFFPATSLRWGTANSVWKTSDEYPLSRNTNLRSTVQVYHFFLGSKKFQCMFSLVYCTRTTSSSLLLLLISPMFVFGSNSKGFKEFKSGISFSLKSLSSVLFSFFMFFLSFSVLFYFFLSLLIKRLQCFCPY